MGVDPGHLAPQLAAGESVMMAERVTDLQAPHKSQALLEDYVLAICLGMVGTPLHFGSCPAALPKGEPLRE